MHVLTGFLVMCTLNHTDLAAAQRVGSFWGFVLIEMMHKHNRDKDSEYCYIIRLIV